MKKIGKRVVTMLAVAAMISLPGCGNSETEVKGETYRTSKLSVLVPEGWKAFSKADIFDKYPGEQGDPTGVLIYKGAKDDLDVFRKPGITIDYYPPDSAMGALKDHYPDRKERQPVTTGPYTWERFSTVANDHPLTVLTVKEPHQIQVAVWEDVEKQKISLEDADLKAILASIKIK